jgi:hypothetical protein
MPVQGRLSPKNLRDERADGTVIGEAFEETKRGLRRGQRRCGYPPLREGNVDGLVTVFVVGLATCQGWRDLERQRNRTRENGNVVVITAGSHKAPLDDGWWQ